MRFLPRIVALLLLFSHFSHSQDRLQVVSTTPLPKNLLKILGGGLRAGCPQEGGALFGLPPVTDTNWRMIHEMVALRPDGTVRASIDLDKVPGMGMAFIVDFAPGPDGEIYVAAKKIVSTHSAVDQKGQIYERYHEEDPQLWVLRFSDAGRVLAIKPVEAEFAFVRLAVFPSGSFLLVGHLSVASLPGQPLPEPDVIPYAAIFSREAKLVRHVPLPDTVLLTEPRSFGFVKQPEPMLGADGNVYVVAAPSEKPALTVVHPEGTVSGTVEIRIPNGYLFSEPRLAGERLIAQISEIKPQNPTQEVVEVDVHTGDLMYEHLLPAIGLRLSCQMQSRGIEVYNPFTGLDTLMVGGEKQRKLH